LNYLKSNKNPFLLFILLFIICTSLFPWNREYYLSLRDWSYDNIESSLNGFSSWESISEFNRNPINKVLIFIKNKRRDLFHDSNKDFKTIHLEVKFKHYKKLLSQREMAIKNNLGFDFTEVKGKITFEGKEMDCKLRLKGDMIDHWRSEKRLSFRIKLKGDNSIMSFKRFSIQKPSTRRHPHDQTFSDLQKQLGNISVSHNYVKLVVNGEDWGIMNIEEHMSKELLEKQKRKESLILKLGDEKFMRYEGGMGNVNLYNAYRLSDEYLNIGVYQDKKYLQDSIYRKYYTYVSNQILKKENKIFDLESFSESLILSLIWNNIHPLMGQNSRYYFNPYDLKIYPIASDQSFFTSFQSRLSIPKLYEKIISIPNFSNNYKNNLGRVKSSLKESQKILDKWQDYFPLDKKITTSILEENLEHYSNYDKFKNNIQTNLDQEINTHSNKITKEQSKFLLDHIHAKHFDNGEINIYNLLNEKVEIKSVCIGNTLIDINRNLVVEGHNFQYNPLIIKTSLLGNYDNQIEIQTEINGYDRLFTLGYTLVKNNISNPLITKSNHHDFDFLEVKEDGTYFIRKGNWDINVPIVLDNGLEIEEGTILNFDENSFLIVKGKLTSIGSENKNIVFKSDQGFWKGVYVLNSSKKSIIENTSFFNVTNLSDGLLNLTGGISFYKSDVDFINVKFINNNSEDFLNIIESNYLLDNVLFENCPSDAFDSDFSEGVISNSTFRNILGDGVDFSGSSVKLNNSFFYNIKDKSVSVGEESSLEINSIYIENSGVGIAVKDGSHANVVSSTFRDIGLSPLMTYTKKSFYSIPKLTSIDNVFEDTNNCCLSQIESELINNTNIVPQKIFNVDSLYQTQVMKK
jgi:hypothetical protein